MRVTFPNSPYSLEQPFPPAGDQPTAIATLVDGIDSGLQYQTLLGVTGSGKTECYFEAVAEALPLARRIVEVPPGRLEPLTVWSPLER